jgi:hypothetical protein
MYMAETLLLLMGFANGPARAEKVCLRPIGFESLRCFPNSVPHHQSLLSLVRLLSKFQKPPITFFTGSHALLVRD